MGNLYTTTAALGGTGGHMLPPFYADFLRENLYGSLFWRQLGTQVTVPRGMGEKVRISRWQTPLRIRGGGRMVLSAFATVGGIGGTQGGATAVITEGLTQGTIISTGILCAGSITGFVSGFGGARAYSDKTVIVSMANFVEGALESLSRELAFRIDRYDRTTVSGSAIAANAILSSGVASAANAVRTAAGLFGKNVARLRPIMGANGCPAWDDGTYVGLAHELAVYDMFKDVSATGFISVARYNDARLIYRGEIGEFYGIRWLLSNASVLHVIGRGANGTDTTFYSAAGSATFGISSGASGSNAYIFSPDAFYNLELDTGGVEVFHQPLGSGGATGDPIGQVGSIGVKVYYGAMPAPSSDRRIIRFIHGTSLTI